MGTALRCNVAVSMLQVRKAVLLLECLTRRDKSVR